MDKHQIDILIKDVWQDDKAKQELISLTGKTQVPCLKINDSGMLESDDIIKKLKDLYQIK